jgi:hypothetical protein
MPRGEREEPRAIATDENGRARLLDGKRRDRVICHTIVPPSEGDRFTAEQALDDDDRFRQSLDSGASEMYCMTA